MRCALLLAILATSPLLQAQPAADTAWEDTLRLSRVKRQVGAALENQPDYTCLATFDRYRWLVNEAAEHKIDTVKVEVAYVGNKELYSWPGEGKFSEVPLTQMVSQGMIGDGMFAVQAHNIFVGNGGVLTYLGEEHGYESWAPPDRKLWHWGFKISVYQSKWTVQQGTQQQIVGAEGSFWVDAQTLDLVRMETHGTDFLEAFPLKAVTSTVDYGRVRIGDQDVLLPTHGELTTITQEGHQNRNSIAYSGCRQYAGQSTISFEAPVEPLPSKPEPAKTVESDLPAGLALKIRLSADINLKTAAVGDVIEGTLSAPLQNERGEIAPKGATVRGRVRMIQRRTAPGSLDGKRSEFMEVGLSFDELSYAGHLAHFGAALKSFDTVLKGVSGSVISERTYSGTARTERVMAAAALEGASTFFVDAIMITLPKGTLMTWITK